MLAHYRDLPYFCIDNFVEQDCLTKKFNNSVQKRDNQTKGTEEREKGWCPSTQDKV